MEPSDLFGFLNNNKEAIAEFKEIYRQKFKKELTDVEAREKASKVASMYYFISRGETNVAAASEPSVVADESGKKRLEKCGS